jgi:hypothetical protein
MARVIRFKVTEQHVRDGQRWMVDHCPFSLALQDKFKTDSVRVGVEGFFRVWKDEQWTYWELLPRGAHALAEYDDNSVPIQPGHYMARQVMTSSKEIE